MNKLFSNRTALVTGGSRGIGRSICEMLAANGARVAINYERNEEAARKTLAVLEVCGVEAMIVQADVSDEEQVARMVAEVRERLGPIELLVNNAGIASSTPYDELPFATWKQMFEVNVDGPFLTTWAVKDEIAGVVKFLLSDDSSFVTGQTVPACGGRC